MAIADNEIFVVHVAGTVVQSRSPRKAQLAAPASPALRNTSQQLPIRTFLSQLSLPPLLRLIVQAQNLAQLVGSHPHVLLQQLLILLLLLSTVALFSGKLLHSTGRTTSGT